MPFDPMAFFSLVVGVPALIAVLVLMFHFKLKMKQLEMRGPDPELGPEVDALRDDLDDTRAQLAHLLSFAELTTREDQVRALAEVARVLRPDTPDSGGLVQRGLRPGIAGGRA